MEWELEWQANIGTNRNANQFPVRFTLDIYSSFKLPVILTLDNCVCVTIKLPIRFALYSFVKLPVKLTLDINRSFKLPVKLTFKLAISIDRTFIYALNLKPAISIDCTFVNALNLTSAQS